MKSQILKSAVFSFIVSGSFGCQAYLPEPSAEQRAESAQRLAEASLDSTGTFFEGQLQVALKEGTSLHQVIQGARDNGISLTLLDQMPGEGLYLLEVSSDQSLRDASVILRGLPQVEAVGRNFAISIQALDPQFHLQWGLVNEGQEAPHSLSGRQGADIEFVAGLSRGSRQVVVAVLDTGIDYLHEDLAHTEVLNGRRVVMPGSNIWVNPAELPGSGHNEDGNAGPLGPYVDDVHGYNFVRGNGDPMDDHGHGTHVAGIIGALHGNFKGIKGVAEDVSLMGVKWLDAGGGGSLWGAQQAIYYVVSMAKQYPEKKFIMNNSWGFSGRISEQGEVDDFLLRAFLQAERAGIFSVFAAGNSSDNVGFTHNYPASYSARLGSTISVAATNNLDELASFSSFGYRHVQVAAPGVMIQSTLPGNRYAAWSGTSMAAPFVAGLAALIWANEPNLSVYELRERIEGTVDILPQLEGLVSSGGRINMRRALEGDFNVRLDPVIERMPLRLESPQLSRSMSFDHVTEIFEPAARSIQLCFESVMLNDGIDWIQIYGEDRRIRDLLTGVHLNENLFTGERRELCTAPIPGERLFVRLVSSSVLDLGGGFQMAFGTEGIRGFVTEQIKVSR